MPRLLNQTTRQSLVLADAAESSHVDAEAVLEALASLGIEIQEDEEKAQTVSLMSAESSDEELKDTQEELESGFFPNGSKSASLKAGLAPFPGRVL